VPAQVTNTFTTMTYGLKATNGPSADSSTSSDA
jgi:hypothetical protein